MSKIVGFCGVEQEAQIEFPFSGELIWLANGGRFYRDGKVTESNTPLVPIVDKKTSDAAKALYKATLEDRAKMLYYSGKNTCSISSNHYNFSLDPSIGNQEFEEIIRTLGPVFSYLFGRMEQGVGFRVDGSRFEINSGHLNTKASIMGGSAIAIAALTALSTGELKLSDFEYKLNDNEEITKSSESGKNRAMLECYKFLTILGKDAKVETNKGEVTIEEILNSVIKTLEPFIIKYCSVSTLKLVKNISEGKEKTDLDFDLISEDEEDFCLLNNYRITRAGILRKFRELTKRKKITLKDIAEKECDLNGPAKFFSMLSVNDGMIYSSQGKTIKGHIYDWRIKITALDEKEFFEWNIGLKDSEGFLKLIKKYESKPQELFKILKFVYKDHKKSASQLRNLCVLSLLEENPDGLSMKELKEKMESYEYRFENYNPLLARRVKKEDIVSLEKIIKLGEEAQIIEHKDNEKIVLTKKGKKVLDILDPTEERYATDIDLPGLRGKYIQLGIGPITTRKSKLRMILKEMYGLEIEREEEKDREEFGIDFDDLRSILREIYSGERNYEENGHIIHSSRIEQRIRREGILEGYITNTIINNNINSYRINNLEEFYEQIAST